MIPAQQHGHRIAVFDLEFHKRDAACLYGESLGCLYDWPSRGRGRIRVAANRVARDPELHDIEGVAFQNHALAGMIGEIDDEVESLAWRNHKAIKSYRRGGKALVRCDLKKLLSIR